MIFVYGQDSHFVFISTFSEQSGFLSQHFLFFSLSNRVDVFVFSKVNMKVVGTHRKKKGCLVYMISNHYSV